MSKSAFFAG